MSWAENIPFETLIGKTLVSVVNRGDEILFTCDDGTVYRQYHSQDCCESVHVEDIVGDLDDLVGEPIVSADVRTNSDDVRNDAEFVDEHFTWTFYHIATRKGSVVIRWYGSSNGYYSEGVDFVVVK